MLPQVNARLLKVERIGGTAPSGYTEDYDRPATDPEAVGGEGEDLWTGRRPAYWIESRRRVTEGTTSRVIVQRSLLLDPRLPHEIGYSFSEGDHVTVEHAGVEKSGQVSTVELRAIPEGALASLRLTMEDA